MPAGSENRLSMAIGVVVATIQECRGRCIDASEAKTRLVEPVLEALGWNIRDPDRVQTKFDVPDQSRVADYALKPRRKPRVLITVTKSREVCYAEKEALHCAMTTDVEWCVLTDGDEYRFYNATAAVLPCRRLFQRFRLSEAVPVVYHPPYCGRYSIPPTRLWLLADALTVCYDAEEILEWISPRGLLEKRIDDHWLICLAVDPEGEWSGNDFYESRFD